MKRVSSPLLIAPVALALGLLPRPCHAQDADFQWSGTLVQGRTIEIAGVNGGIDARPSTDGRVHVEATKHARRSDPASVRIEVVEHADGVTICAVYPTPQGAREENDCRPGGGSNSVNNNDVTVDFVVRVPAGVAFTGRTVNGGVEARGLASDVDASTVNGGVRVETSGFARASTVNGDVHARMASGPTEDVSFSTVNGSIEVALPAGAAADVSAGTVNGDIDTDFDLTVRGRFSNRSMQGRLGGGGPELDLSTVNGSIRLLRL